MKKTDTVFLGILSFIILFLGIAVLVVPQKSFSEKENRYLTKAPSVSIRSIATGDLFKELNNFYSDQFPFRDSFTSLYAISELSLGQCQVNDVVFCNDLLLRREKSQDLSQALSTIEELCGDQATLYVPPSSAEVFRSELPPSLQNELGECPTQFTQYTYYKTDHHWTTHGAYTAYTEICDMLGISAFEEDYFKRSTVCTDFRGTAYARACLPEWMISPDTITLYRYDGDEYVDIFCHDTNTQRLGFYEMGALNGNDKYRVFLGGNYARLTISSDSSKERLVLVKDSFANSVIPFLALHFNIEVIDPRYCSKNELVSLLNKFNSGSERVLILMSKATLIECFN